MSVARNDFASRNIRQSHAGEIDGEPRRRFGTKNQMIVNVKPARARGLGPTCTDDEERIANRNRAPNQSSGDHRSSPFHAEESIDREVWRERGIGRSRLAQSPNDRGPKRVQAFARFRRDEHHLVVEPSA